MAKIENKSIDRLIDNLPSFFQAQKGMLIHSLFKAVGRELDEIDIGMDHVFKSWLVDYADKDINAAGLDDDLLKNARIFGITIEEGETPGEFKDRVKDAILDYAFKRPERMPDDLTRIALMFDLKPESDESAETFRKRLKATIHIYLSGMGTIDAIIGMTALTYLFDPEKTSITRPSIEDPFTTTALLKNTSDKISKIKTIENPPVKIRSRQIDLFHGIIFEVYNKGLFDVFFDIEIQTQANGMAFPVITNLTSQEQLIFNGIIPKDEIFLAKAGSDKASPYTIYIGNRTTEGLNLWKGDFFDSGKFDYAYFIEPGSRLVLPIGRSEIRFDLKDPFYDEAFFNASVFQMDEVGQFDLKAFDNCAFKPAQPNGKLTLSWEERKPASFKIDLPFSLFSEEQAKTIKLKKVIAGIKPAGVEAVIGTNKELALEEVILEDELKEYALKSINYEQVKNTDFINTFKLKKSGHEEAQDMFDTLKFRGIFEMTRFEESLFI